MKNLGFNGKSYTLWETTSNDTDNGLYTTRVTTYRYIKALSKDLAKAIKLAELSEDAEVLDILRTNKRSFINRVERLNFRTDRFIYGKYRGKTPEEIEDNNYLEWAYNNFNDSPELKKIIRKVLLSRGYISFFKKILISPEDIKLDKERTAIINTIENGSSFTIEMTKNLNTEGEYNTKLFTYKFKNFRMMCYAGYYYSFPIDGNGKAKS